MYKRIVVDNLLTLRSHTHWQVAQNLTKTKTYQRVCLPQRSKTDKWNIAAKKSVLI